VFGSLPITRYATIVRQEDSPVKKAEKAKAGEGSNENSMEKMGQEDFQSEELLGMSILNHCLTVEYSQEEIDVREVLYSNLSSQRSQLEKPEGSGPRGEEN
jgi:hypothetical protein